MLDKTKKQVPRDVIHVSVLQQIMRSERPITALVIFITLYKVYHFPRRWCSTARATRA